MESLASLDLPAYGYGIRYVNGMFRQRIDDGWQVELPETWLVHGNPWEFPRRESAYHHRLRRRGDANSAMVSPVAPGGAPVRPPAIDTPVVGWRGKRVNTLRLWTAQALDPDPAGRLQRRRPHRGPGRSATAPTVWCGCCIPPTPRRPGRSCGCARSISSPSASIQDIVRRHVQYFGDIRTLPEKAAIQLNDTHPAVAVAELMRLLIDLHELDFDGAGHHGARPSPTPTTRCCPRRWKAGRCRCSSACCRATCRSSMASTPAAAEARAGRTGAMRAISAISLIDESGDRRVRMANLAFAGSHSVNGVAALHTELMKTDGVRRSAQRSIPTASTTRPMASPRAAGCSNAIPVSPI